MSEEECEGPIDPLAREVQDENVRIAALESEVAALRGEVEVLRRAFEEFKGQF